MVLEAGPKKCERTVLAGDSAEELLANPPF